MQAIFGFRGKPKFLKIHCETSNQSTISQARNQSTSLKEPPVSNSLTWFLEIKPKETKIKKKNSNDD